MATCVTLNADGTLSPTGQPVEECAGYVLLSSSEVGIATVITDALAMPTPEMAAEWFAGTFGLVVGVYVVARWAGTIPNMFSK